MPKILRTHVCGASLALLLAGLLGCGSSSGGKANAANQSDAGSSDSAGNAGGRIYVTVSSSHEVLVLDDQTHEQLSSIQVGAGPAIIVATPSMDKLYTANWKDNTVSAITTADESVKSIALLGRPYVIAMDPAGERVYAGVDNKSIVVIDTEKDEVAKTFATDELPASLIVSPDGKTLYVATLGSNALYALSTADGSQAHPPVMVGNSPAWITIGKDGSKVYTLNFLSDDISVVDTASWKVQATVNGGTGSGGIIGNVTPDGSRLYVTNYGTGDMIAIDTKTNEVVQTIELGARPVGVNFSPDGKRVYATDFGPKSLKGSVVDALSFLTTGNLTIQSDGQVRAFDIATGDQVGETVTTAAGPTSVVVSGSK
jgi:YVTN family beta-propeller protein